MNPNPVGSQLLQQGGPDTGHEWIATGEDDGVAVAQH